MTSRRLTLLSTFLCLVTVVSCEKNTAVKLDTDQQKVSYALGAQVGSTLARQSIAVDQPAFVEGMADGLKGGDLRLDHQAYNAAILMAQNAAVKKQMQNTEAAEKNRKDGEAFLAKNKSRPEVSTTASGLQYEILKQGKGAQPVAGDIVEVHFTGTLLDGSKFDSSLDRGAPTQLAVDTVIPGWSEALKLMNVGSKWKVAIPAHLAYKEAGSPPLIPANSVLLFDLELIAVTNKPTPPKKSKPK